MTTAMIHQPHFLPWPPYIARCLAADVFIVLDNVKFNKDYYHNRTLLTGRDGPPYWLTLPIDHSTRELPIGKVLTASDLDTRRWVRSAEGRHEADLRGSVDWHVICETVASQAPHLGRINTMLIAYILDKVALHVDVRSPKILAASSYDLPDDRTDRLIALCEATDADTLIMGNDAYRVHDSRRMRDAGLRLVCQSRKEGASEFRTGLSFIDYVFRLGWRTACREVFENWLYPDWR